ncbi:MAG: hypothetical protein ACI9M9_000606 [Flavobacteriaceae bacterium]|jgi:hypothetical protein
MQSKATTPKQYINDLPEDRKAVITRLRKIILDNLPNGFEECMNYEMLGYMESHSVYPDGYHFNPKPLQSPPTGLLKDVPKKFDMGQSRMLFKYLQKTPFDLIGELVSKVSVKDWIEPYERLIKR